jgi:ABC-type phosphate transport system substrate-binding protein
MNRKSRLFATGFVGLATLAVLFTLGCSDYTDEGGKPEEPKWNTTNKRPFFASGSTFIAPLISRWATDYENAQPVHVNYHPIGSGAGIANLRKGIGAFAASDAPPKR